MLLADGKHVPPATGTTHCTCCMWVYLHALLECRSFGGENACDARQELMLSIVVVPQLLFTL